MFVIERLPLKLCYCAYSAFIVKRFSTVNNHEALLSPKLYSGKLWAPQVFNVTNLIDLFTGHFELHCFQ